MRGPTYKGSLTGGAKSLFRLPRRVHLFRGWSAEAAIDALSVAAIESLRKDTLYIATGGGMGPGTIAALEELLASIAMLPGALLCSAADANGPGDRFADRHRSLGENFRISFVRLRPPIEGGATGTTSCAPDPKREERRHDHARRDRRSFVRRRPRFRAPEVESRLDLLNPDPQAWTDDDLAAGLSRTMRWGGAPNGVVPSPSPSTSSPSSPSARPKVR